MPCEEKRGSATGTSVDANMKERLKPGSGKDGVNVWIWVLKNKSFWLVTLADPSLLTASSGERALEEIYR